MKVQNMTNANGKAVPNQFIIRIDSPSIYGNFLWREVFQSYNSVIAIKTKWENEPIKIELDKGKWDFSKTTGKYRNQFLGETKKETEAKIKSGAYILTDLNK
jgi:hypothetical protein